MAHSNRKRRKELRLAAKKARKAAWVSLIGLSRNKKKKSASSNKHAPMGKVLTEVPVEVKGLLVLGYRMLHRGARCYNVGCKRCSPFWRTKHNDLNRQGS